MGYQKWSYELLHGFCMDAFEKFGFTVDNVVATVKSIL